MLFETTHEALAEAARDIWSVAIYPKVGDVGAMLFGLPFGAGVMVAATEDYPVDWALWLATHNPPKDTIDWVGWVGTAYTDTVDSLEEAMSVDLNNQPTPTTQHVLVASIVTKDLHASSTSWVLDLGPDLTFGEQLMGNRDDIEVGGAVPDALRVLMLALT